MAERRFVLGWLAATMAALAGCATPPAPPAPTAQREPDGFPDARYRQLAAQGQAVFRVDAARSLLTIEVRRGGSLAQLGHDHVVASHDLAGWLAPDAGRADFWVPLDALVVDEAALRLAAGFITQPSAADIAGTRDNMLKRVLETERYPFALIAVSAASGSPVQARLTLTLHGISRSLDTPLRLERSDAALALAGQIELALSDFGIAPFSVLGGALAVQDRIKVSFRVEAQRLR